MSCHKNQFWDRAGIAAFDCQRLQTPSPLNNPPNWNCKETVDLATALELLQGAPSCYHESQDEWLGDFKWLEEVYNRAQYAASPRIATPEHGRDDIEPTQKVRRVTKQNSPLAAGDKYVNNASGVSHGWVESSNSSMSYDIHGPFSNTGARARVQEDSAGSTTPTPTTYRSLADSQSPDSRVTTVNTPQLYDWYSAPYDNQEHVERVVEGLREMERVFRAGIKRRISQVEQSRPE
ncbi:hypothetical protein HD806DRAFT_539944 [Xylariaceae sp. AK1471]|nr:hypothetical protein HD806DRAFT_539944 [Xylariaceae sp. AK1471]